MSISGALSNALSGLTASARATDVVSSNLANVLTEGFGARGIELVSQRHGQSGVSVVGITRHTDLVLLGDRRLADSAIAHSDTRAQFITQLERIVGTPDDSASLSARIAAFDAALVTAGSRPAASDRLQAAVRRAGDLTNSLNNISAEIQNRRTEADGEIARAVETVNTSLEQIRELNIQISAVREGSGAIASLQDHRQLAIDRLSEFIPVRQVPRENGMVALFTPGGAILLDGNAATLGFTASNVVAPHMTLGNGLLSGLQINGVTIAPSGDSGPIAGGKLAALFEVRDDLSVDAQEQIDALARDLIERFQQPGLDGSRAPGDPGLFTDAGSLFDPVDETGIAGRIAVNALVDPDQGGALWRLRDGLGAVAPGATGNGVLLQQLQGALSDPRSLNSGDLGAVARSATGHASSLVSRIGQDSLTLDQSLAFAKSRQSELKKLELQQGVDTDAEMQRLLLIEQAYGANARMIQTVDDMIQTLLRI